MDIIHFIRLAVFPLIFTLLLIWAPRLKQQTNGLSIIHKLLAGAGCFLIAAISAIPVPVVIWLHLAGIATMHYGILCFYFAVDHLLNNKRYIPILKNHAFITTTGLTLVNLVVDYSRRDNLVPFIDYDVERPTLSYYSGELLHYGTLLYIAVVALRLYRINFHQQGGIAFSFRRVAGFLTFVTGFIATALLCIGLVVSMVWNDSYRVVFTTFYHYSKLIILGLVLVGFALPQSFIQIWMYPIERYQRHRAKKEHALLAHLHRMMTTLVPFVVLESDNTLLRHYRMEVEINEAREILYSHYPNLQFSPASKEAGLMRRLHHERAVYLRYGSHTPQLPSDSHKRNLAVARRLMRPTILETFFSAVLTQRVRCSMRTDSSMTDD